MSEYTTIVIKRPDDADGRAKVQQGFELLKPYITAMSLESDPYLFS